MQQGLLNTVPGSNAISWILLEIYKLSKLPRWNILSTISAGRDALTHEDEMQNAVSISLKREICKHLETL